MNPSVISNLSKFYLQLATRNDLRIKHEMTFYLQVVAV